LTPLAPISAVAWDYGSRKFQICLFSIAPDNHTLIQMSFSKGGGGWDEDVDDTKEVTIANGGEPSAVAAVRIPENGSISVFYQPEKKVIGLFSASGSKRIPLGIPTTGLSKAEKQREEAVIK
jgi:hypothetical protein